MKNNVRELTAADAKELASLHVRSFPNFFLTSLGQTFLVSFYKSALTSAAGFGIGIYQQEQLVGFAVGTSQIGGFYKRLIKEKGFTLLFNALPALLMRPLGIVRILNNLRGSKSSFSPQSGGWLLSICTDVAHQGSGVSSDCLNAFENFAVNTGMDKIWLTTDTSENERANKFYSRQGYKIYCEITDNERTMNLYYKELL